MSAVEPGELIRLKDTDETIADTAADIRGRRVVDKDGQTLGKIDALLIDEKEQKVRFLEVESGGFLGLGEKKSLIPVDAITGIGADEVRVGHTSQKVAAAPAYDPEFVKKASFYGDTYGFYGYMPYWGMGYAYPQFPPLHNDD